MSDAPPRAHTCLKRTARLAPMVCGLCDFGGIADRILATDGSTDGRCTGEGRGHRPRRPADPA